ncbi:MAG: arylsulfatase [Balneolaceae bacterium]|nr:arylsulfatase [Balneolaceae bacterium]
MSKHLAIILITLSSLFLISCEEAEHADSAQNPNIIIIYTDDVGYGDVGVYGAELIQTPNIDQLAAEGIRFTDAYATSSTCTPSRYSLLTGVYAFRNPRAQVLPGDAPMLIEPGSLTLPGTLQKAGYRTSVIGKWHLGLGDGDLDWNGKITPGPLEVGFDESFLLPATNDRVPTVYVDGHYVYNLSEDDDPLRVSFEGQVGDLPTGHSHPEMLRYPADDQHSGTIVGDISRIGFMDGGQSAWWDDEEMAFLFAERSETFIRENAGSDQPFFLYLSMHENHVPRAPHPQFVGTSGVGLRGDTVHELDWVVGDVVRVLEELNIREETLIIFTSDNGPVLFDGYEDGALEQNQDHDPNGGFRGGKYIAFEGGTRLPFIVSWPGQVEPGMVSEAMISQVDLLATFASLTGVDISGYDHLDSQDMLDALTGQNVEGNEFIIQHSSDGLAIRKGPWKYIEPGSRASWAYNRHNLGDTPLNIEPLNETEYLFNLDEDPRETTNMAGEYPDKIKEMRALLEEVRETPLHRRMQHNQ